MATEAHKAVEHLKPQDIFTVSDDMPASELTALTHYLSAFANPRNEAGHFACINCGEEVDGFKQALGVGVAYRWGIVHGEANCTGCGWPARGMHYVKDEAGKEIVSIRNLFLPYHPDFVTSKASS
jgi:hypothetical protein